jgi:hypothetical protein
MPSFRLFQLGLASSAALALAACRDDTNPTAPDVPPASARVQAGPDVDLPPAAELARQVPGFGGFFIDPTGTPTVYLTRGSSRVPAERMLARYLAGRGLAAAAMRVVEARYHWQQLERWQASATQDALAVPGAVFVDNDETSNRVKIGVANQNVAGQVRSAMARLGIPDDAVMVEQTDPIVQLATLANAVDRPVRAGVQINFPGFLCSVGFNATSGTQKSFITASHCTNTQGGVESTPYWQPLRTTAPTQIATEVADPVYSSSKPNCPKNKICRFSDASRAKYLNGANQALGRIAKTGGANNGSLTITGSFTITSNDCGTTGGCLAVGATVNKVGRTTGWTSGKITNTCVNTGVDKTRIVQLCQTWVSAGVGGGDSGSDVFRITSGTNVKLAGILWGGGTDANGRPVFVFSPYGNITRELGALTTH